MNKRLFLYSVVSGAALLCIIFIPTKADVTLSRPYQQNLAEHKVASLPTPEAQQSKDLQQSTQYVPIIVTISDQKYNIQVPYGSTGYEAMLWLASTTPVVFKSTYHDSLGYFIESINGLKNKDGTYWTLYVNGTYSLVGISQVIINQEDTIEWKYEKK